MVLLQTRTFLPVLAFSLIVASSAWAQPVDRDLEFRIRATEVLQGILDGIAEGDYGKFTRDFSSSLKQSQDREGFLQLQRKIQKSLGKLRSTEFLGFYEQQRTVITLFKVRFTKSKDDVLIRLVFDGKKPSSKLTGLWFDSPAME